MSPRRDTSLSWLPFVLALFWLSSLSSVAGAQNASATRITPFPDAGVSRPSPISALAYPADTTYLPLSLNNKKLLEGWTEYNTKTCKDISTGMYKATTAPKFGKLSFNIQNFTNRNPPCAGVVFPYDAANYTWTAKTSSAPQDFFSLQWTTPDGKFTENSDWLAELLPQSETTAFQGWAKSISQATMGEWQQTIALQSVAYKGVTVQESNPGGGGPDTCWFSGSKYTPFNSITGGTWTVKKGNIWGFDYVGYFQGPVTYYRAKGRAPCGTKFPQQMQIKYATGDPKFYNYGTVNILGGKIGTKTVTSIRAGQSKTETWP